MSRINDPMGNAEVETMREATHQVSQGIRDMGNIAKEAARTKLEQARVTASEYYRRGKDRAMKWEESMETHVREKPIQSLLIAAGVGLALGLLLRRRH